MSGSLRATDTLYSTTSQFTKLYIPTESNGTTFGPGSSGQILKSNGTSVYWTTDNNNAVTQTGNSEDKAYPILLKNTNNTTNETTGVKYSNNVTSSESTSKPFTYNPSTGILSVPKIQISIKDDNYGFLPYANNWNSLGASNLYWFKAYITHHYGSTSHIANWDADKNIGTASTSSAAATKGTVNFYNVCAAGGTQTKTTLAANSDTTSNVTITLPSSTGTLALVSTTGSNTQFWRGDNTWANLPKATTSADGIVDCSAQAFAGKKTFKFSSRIYPRVGVSEERSTWYKITLPYYNATTESSAQWFMNSFDLHFGGVYNENPNGVAHIAFYWTRAANNGAWSVNQANARIDGVLAYKVKFYYRTSEPGVLYINNSANVYNGIWMDNFFEDDTFQYNYTADQTTIATCDAITVANYTQMPSVYTYSSGTNYCIDNPTIVSKKLISYSDSGVYYSTGSPMFYFLRGNTTATANKLGGIFMNSTTVNNITAPDRFYFRHYTYNSTSGEVSENWEQYRLPSVSADRTTSVTYEILTTKNYGNVENTKLSTWTGSANISTVGTITSGTWSGSAIALTAGGTGANSAAGARTNLNVYSKSETANYINISSTNISDLKTELLGLVDPYHSVFLFRIASDTTGTKLSGGYLPSGGGGGLTGMMTVYGTNQDHFRVLVYSQNHIYTWVIDCSGTLSVSDYKTY